jgi:hypothetical protein
LTYELLLNAHTEPDELLENTNDVFMEGLAVENVVEQGFKKVVPFVILYGESFVESIVFPAESSGSPNPFLPDG